LLKEGAMKNINRLNSSILLQMKEKMHRLTYPKNEFLMKQAVIRFKECKNKKSEAQIKREIKICKDYWGCYPLHYYRYDLYRKDREVTDNVLIDYIPEFFFYSLFLNYYDTRKFSILTEDKNVMELIFNSLNIKQPIVILKIVKGNFYNQNMGFISENKVEELILSINSEKIFVKPVDGEGGNGIYIFTRGEDGLFRTKDNILLDHIFLKEIRNRDFIIQSGVNQNEYLSKMYPSSVNTFRIATENLNGKARIICGTLRIGKHGKEVDNGSQGGLVLGIKTDSGTALDFAITEQGKKYYEHPDTGFKFKDLTVPNWEEVKKFTVSSAEKLATYTYLGWDIALSKEGPLAIETNMGFGLDHFQVPFGGLRKEFNIENPMEYWKKISNSSTYNK
jgi:hypothetical protein